MSELLRSALSNISSNWGASATNDDAGHSEQENEFVGETIDLKGHRLRVERVIAEGKSINVVKMNECVIIVGEKRLICFLRGLWFCVQCSRFAKSREICPEETNCIREGSSARNRK